MEIKHNAVTEYLITRWIGCYLVYDENLRHAENALHNNTFEWKSKALERVGGGTDENSLTSAFNMVLAEETEKFFEHLTKSHTRAEIELFVAEAIAEMLA